MELEQVTTIVLQYLESKSFFGAERALRAELALALEACEHDANAMKVCRGARPGAGSEFCDSPCSMHARLTRARANPALPIK